MIDDRNLELDAGGIRYDPETERYLFATIFDDPAKIWQVRQVVRETDFAVPMHVSLYSAMCGVADRGKLVTPVAVNDWLVQAGRSHEVPIGYPHEITDLGVYGYAAMEYAEIVRRYGERRKLYEVGARIRDLASAGDDEGGDIVEQAAELIDGLRLGTLRESRPIGDSFDAFRESLRDVVPHIPTPWPSLNAIIGGIRPGGLYVVAGRSGHGKSIFGLQLAQHVAESAGRVGYVSLEMTKADLMGRLVAMMQGIHQSAIQNHQLTADGWAAVDAAETALRAMPLEVDDRSGATWSDVVGWARALKRKGDLKLIVIDYFGLLASPPGSRSRSADLERWANAAKALAKDLECSVLLLEQLNRDSVERKTPRPVITDLRGTAALEHAADAVILLHRPEKRLGGKNYPTGEIEFIVAKNRQGQPGERTLYFQGEYARIVQKEYEHTTLVD